MHLRTHTIGSVPVEVFGVHISPFLCQHLHGPFLAPAHGCMEWSPTFVVLDVQVDTFLSKEEVQHLLVPVGSCYMELCVWWGRRVIIWDCSLFK